VATGTVRAGGRGASNFEFYSWYFFRVSGLLLVVLALGHFALMHVIHSILDVDYAFAARRWTEPAWRVYDWLLLTLALLHGFNGVRVIATEYIHSRSGRRAAQWVVGVFTLGFFLLGTYVLVAFHPPVP
jgi:succinate dehydrogenase / fumarate reductase membrane anchor subunit